MCRRPQRSWSTRRNCSQSSPRASLHFLGVLINGNAFKVPAFYTCRDMYGTTARGSILRAGMDGSSPAMILTGLQDPKGIAIDFEFGHLYWTEWKADRIQRSDLQGRGVQPVLQLPSFSRPWGIAVDQERIYWSTAWNPDSQLGSCTKAGTDVRSHFNAVNWMSHITFVPDLNLPTNRTNHCAGQRCAKVCVLTRTSFHCVA